MKYMIMMFGGIGAAVQGRSPEWLAGMQEMIMQVDADLRDAGELVASVKLMDPTQATTVRFADGAPIPSDGPFAEVKESLAGYWIIDANEARAVEITSRVVGYTEFPMEVRRIMDEATDL
jgi:hypothetical protein